MVFPVLSLCRPVISHFSTKTYSFRRFNKRALRVCLKRINSHEVPSCPICLYPPLAARITRCGHIFCWPCMLHYLSLSERSWSKCPICYEAVHTADLKR